MINRKNFAEAHSRREPGPLLLRLLPTTPQRALVGLPGRTAAKNNQLCEVGLPRQGWGCRQCALICERVSSVMTVKCGRSVFWGIPELSGCASDIMPSQLCAFPRGILSAQSTLLSPPLYFFKTLAMFCFITFYFILEYSWFAMLCFRCTAKWFSFTHTHTHTHTPPLFFQILFPYRFLQNSYSCPCL